MIFFSILGKELIYESLVGGEQSFLVIVLFPLLFILAFPGKFGAVFASIPAPIIAALYCLFFAYVGTYM